MLIPGPITQIGSGINIAMMALQEIFIKNMVCDRCIRVVRAELERAKELLSYQELSINEIAHTSYYVIVETFANLIF